MNSLNSTHSNVITPPTSYAAANRAHASESNPSTNRPSNNPASRNNINQIQPLSAPNDTRYGDTITRIAENPNISMRSPRLHNVLSSAQSGLAKTLGKQNLLGYSTYWGFDALKKYTQSSNLPLQQALLDAVQSGDLTLIEQMLNQSANPNYQDEEGFTALHHAANSGNYKAIKLLLQGGAAVNVVTNGLSTPLHIAATSSPNIQTVRQLLAAHANPNAPDHFKQTPLHEAAFRADGNLEFLKLLIEHPKTDLNARDSEGHTALYSAIVRGHNEAALMLLNATKNLNQRFEGGNTLFMVAVKAGNEEMAKALLEKGAAVNATNSNKENAVQIAILHRQPALFEALIEAGGSIYQKNSKEETAMHLAARTNQPDVAQKLIDQVSKQPLMARLLYTPQWYINQKNGEGETALHIAYQHPDAQITNLLLENKANEAAIDLEGFLPKERA